MANREATSEVLYEVWKSKIRSQKLRKMTKLSFLLPTTEAFTETVKRAHYQACVGKPALQLVPPHLDDESSGKKKENVTKNGSPVTVLI